MIGSLSMTYLFDEYEKVVSILYETTKDISYSRHIFNMQ